MDPAFDCETSFYPGWESYPMNPRGGNPYRLNALEYNERLSQDACRLFCPDDEQYVRILHGGGYSESLYPGHHRECFLTILSQNVEEYG
jgi:hypothetical protein